MAIIKGTNAADSIVGTDELDRLYGLGGNDLLLGSGEYDRLYGGRGDDILHAAGASQLHGGSGNDSLSGNTGNDELYGGAGDDQLSGQAGNDLLVGGNGGDYLSAGSGNDTLLGGAGDDGFDFAERGPDFSLVDVGNDLIDGGRGIDSIFFASDFYSTTSPLVADLEGGAYSVTGGTGRLINIENIWGTNFDDHIYGSDTANGIVGNGGNDFVDARGGNDMLDGGSGDDVLYGGSGDDHFAFFNFSDSAGADYVDGGEGVDTVDYRASFSSTHILVDLSTGAASMGATVVNIENAIGAFDANDTLRGDSGANVLWGVSGNDILIGEGGNDILIGDEGADTLTGGDGADVFVGAPSTGADQIIDFSGGVDKLVLSSTDVFGAEGDFAPNDPRFYSAAGAISGHDADDRVIYDASTGNLYSDPDGSGAVSATLMFTLESAPTVAGTDITVLQSALALTSFA
jgi:Ca2+-binding RTX toxin-like protein